MKAKLAMYLCALLAALPGSMAAQTLINYPTLSADAAQEVLAAALAFCRKEGHKVSITVLDVTGRPKVSVRDDGSNPHSYEHSLRKAYTALTYDMSSIEYGKRAAENPGAIGPLLLPNITTSAGGLPIRAGNTLVGAIGVSGTPRSGGGGGADAKCAQAGIDRIAKGLAAGR